MAGEQQKKTAVGAVTIRSVNRAPCKINMDRVHGRGMHCSVQCVGVYTGGGTSSLCELRTFSGAVSASLNVFDKNRK